MRICKNKGLTCKVHLYFLIELAPGYINPIIYNSGSHHSTNMSAASEDINVEERFSEMPKQEDLVSNGSDNLFAPDIDGELYADGEFSGAQNSMDPRVRNKSGFYFRLKQKAIVFIYTQ